MKTRVFIVSLMGRKKSEEESKASGGDNSGY
jgi:hypothetical protein